MRVRLLGAIAPICVFATVASAAPGITVGDIQVAPNTTFTFPLDVTGGGAVAGLDLYIQIADGGAANGGVATKPIITNVDITGSGTLFHGNNTGQQNALSSDLLWAVSTTTLSGDVDAKGTIAYVTINTNGTAPGDRYPLMLTGVADGIFGSPGVNTAFAGVEATIGNGTIVIAPEPMAMGTVLGGSLLLLVRKRQKPPIR